MTEQTFATTTSRLSFVDRYSPAVLLPLAILFGLAAQYLFYGVGLGINLGIASLALLAAAWRLRPAGARLDRADRWIAPAAIGFAFLPAIRSDLMLLLFDAPATVVLVTMAAVSFAGVPLTRRVLDVLIALGFVVAGRILAGGALLLAADALFLFFVALQIAYLFGGVDTLNATGLTYSEYGRRGFFELIAVAVLAGGLVFGVELVVAHRSRLYVGAALALVVATCIVVVSAAYRMHLYQLAYGWTEQRFYALAGIGWLGGASLVAAILIWRNETRWLLHAAGLLGLAVAFAVNLIGPSAFVARQDLERVVNPSGLPDDARRVLDAYYLGSLGDGAVPTLVEYLPRLGASDRQALGSALRTFALEKRDLSIGPWQTQSVDRVRAREALLGVADELRNYPLLRFGVPIADRR